MYTVKWSYLAFISKRGQQATKEESLKNHGWRKRKFWKFTFWNCWKIIVSTILFVGRITFKFLAKTYVSLPFLILNPPIFPFPTFIQKIFHPPPINPFLKVFIPPLKKKEGGGGRLNYDYEGTVIRTEKRQLNSSKMTHK